MSNLKRVPQVIEIGDTREWVGTLYGSKTVSIHEGHKDYSKGSIYLISPDGSQDVKANLIGARKCLASEINAEELAGDWYKNQEAMIEDMGRWNHSFNKNSLITVPMWENVRGPIVPDSMPNKLTFYLSHPSESKKDIEKKVKRFDDSRIKIVNPFDEKYNPIPFDKKISQIEREKQVRDQSEKIVSHERNLFKNVHGVIAVIDGNETIGTFCEMDEAYNRFWKPVYAIVTNERENNPWLIQNSTKIFTDWNKLEDFICDLQLQGRDYFYKGKFLNIDGGR